LKKIHAETLSQLILWINERQDRCARRIYVVVFVLLVMGLYALSVWNMTGTSTDNPQCCDSSTTHDLSKGNNIGKIFREILVGVAGIDSLHIEAIHEANHQYAIAGGNVHSSMVQIPWMNQDLTFAEDHRLPETAKISTTACVCESAS
jgi:hypothetical protein